MNEDILLQSEFGNSGIGSSGNIDNCDIDGNKPFSFEFSNL